MYLISKKAKNLLDNVLIDTIQEAEIRGKCKITELEKAKLETTIENCSKIILFIEKTMTVFE